MTPRALAESGLRGTSRKALTEGAKEEARELSLTGWVTILRYHEVSDGGGDVTKTWIPDEEPIRCRLKSVRKLPHQSPIGGRVSESSTHLIEVDQGTEVTTLDRLRVEETTYLIISFEPGTDSTFLQLEVKEA